MKKLFVLLLGVLSFCAEGVLANMSPGKPGAKVSFTDKQIIEVQAAVSQVINLELLSSADQVEYKLFASDGLVLEWLGDDDYVKNQPFTVRVKINASQVGRFYIHCQVTTKTGDETLVSTISRVVVSRGSNDEVTPVYPVARSNKINSTDDYKILTSSESITTDNR